MPETAVIERTATLNIEALLSELEEIRKRNDAGEWMPDVPAETAITASDLIKCIKNSYR